MVTKIEDLLARHGVIVPQRTQHRYCAERTDYRGRRGGTVPVVDGEPGVECQIDFARMGMLTDSVSGRRRVVHALIFTAVHSRHMFVWLTFTQTLAALIEGCEAAWRFFGGVFKELILDCMSAIAYRLLGRVAPAAAHGPFFRIATSVSSSRMRLLAALISASSAQLSPGSCPVSISSWRRQS